MLIKKKALAVFAVLLCLNLNLSNFSYAQETPQQENKYPDYAYQYVGNDKCENFNRKMFVFNTKLNKFVIRPIHIVWASVMPKYGAQRLQNAYANIEYPKRLVSTLIQKDFKASKNETVRFFTNTTLGLGGLYDPAKTLLKIEPTNEDMEQALAKCKVKSGPYLVIPILTSTSPRNIAGRILDTSLNPSSYIATPVLAFVKAGLMVNRTSYLQPLFKMVESTYADPYEVAKKLYGIQNHIQNADLDRKELVETTVNMFNTHSISANTQQESITDFIKSTNNNEDKMLNIKNTPAQTPLEEYLIENAQTTLKEQDKIAANELIRGGASTDNIILKDRNTDLKPDLTLNGYNPQNPVVDSMRTALFDLPGINDSIWNELSVWNRCFSKKIRTSSVNVDPTRENYKFRYILQKDKTAPIAIVYPSIGEGIMSYHSVVLAKLFFDEGYSVIIQGSHFQWEFIKSMPKEYKPGIPSQDADYLKTVTSKILTSLETKHNCKPKEKVVIGTSFGALTTLFLADKEYKNNTMNITKYISINPPVELMYAMKQIDCNTQEWNKNPDDLKNRVAITAAKVVQVAQMKNNADKNIASLPFNEEEAKLITGFIMHQKLSDLIFTIENGTKSKKSDIYQTLNNMNYNDYSQKYLLSEANRSFEKLSYDVSLHSIGDYLKNNNNYKIYHTLDDYLTNTKQLKQLKRYSGSKTVLISNGSHLGFLYRQEFINALKKEISLKDNKLVTNKI